MILDCLFSLFRRKYNGYKVYVHNLAKFDIIFLLKYLVQISKVEPIIHNGKIISLSVKYGDNNKYQIEFKDSYLILKSALIKLCKAFSVENPKTIFPYLFVNKDNLNYEGVVPEYKYFDNKCTKSEYLGYKLNFNNN
jgi:hypothetical protein